MQDETLRLELAFLQYAVQNKIDEAISKYGRFFRNQFRPRSLITHRIKQPSPYHRHVSSP